MKWPNFVIGFAAAVVATMAAARCSAQIRNAGPSGPTSQNKTAADYPWVMSLPPGTGRFPEVCGEGQWPMAIVPLVALEGKLWMVAQKNVWSSRDGIRFTAQPKTDWGERYGEAYVFFKNKIWMLGGMRAWDDFTNDVWYSSDARQWKQATPSAAWCPRRSHGAVVFNNRIWVLGGAVSTGQPDQVPSRFLNDVWCTADGDSWTQVTEDAPWSPRDGHVSLVFDDKMWVIGGGGKRDVWNSANGRNWTRATGQAEWGQREGNGGVAFDGRLWIFGGRGLNDVWHSQDGTHWQPATAHTPWGPRTTVHSVVFADKLWIYSGKTGRQDSWAGDVWSMVRTDAGSRSGDRN